MIAPAQLALWLLILVPAVGGAALLLARRADRLAGAISVATAAVVVGLSIAVAVTRPAISVSFVAGAQFALSVDPLAAVVVPAVAVVTLLVLVFAVGDIREAAGRFHGLMLVFASAAVLTATAATLPALLLAWEVMGAASYALIGFWWRDEFRMSAGLTAFVTTRTADLGLYLGAGAALAGGAGLALADLPHANTVWRNVIAAGVLIAALGKAAQLPFSFWLSRAMEGPSPVSALLHSAAMVAMGAYLLLRIEPLLAATGWAAEVAAWAGAATAVLLGAVAVAQRDLKQLLAASTAAQLGFVVLAAGVGTVSGGTAQLVAHASTKAGLFLAAGVWLSLAGTKQLDQLRDVARRWPLVGWSATVAAVALAGIPPLSLWATKDAVLTVALDHSPALYGAGLVAAALSAAYAAKILVAMWRKAAPSGGSEQRKTLGANVFQQLPIVVLALGAAVTGVLALPPIAPTLSRVLDNGRTAQAAVPELAASALVALVVVAAIVHWGVPEPRWAVDWLGLERAAHAAVVRPTMRLADLLARFDDQVLDRAVHRIAAGSLRAARWAAGIDDRGVDAAVEAVAARMRGLGELARKPQTGLLHQYYLAAVVFVALGVLLLVAVR
ncbi:proton-conducting transporter membrane subunit [Mycobacterium intracellulare subsp. chimaera]|uniref:Proton-conducting transporter membrane subunit n=1 Tax=Mycobacterium intracellulare subsp. chimaera TaxID=222805 RepID=A0ABT7P802_MYCIT|nr:proton-conducting transporter membrane subunit [Mycobacterium intracellulare]ASL09449.1 NADH dehydrogenase (quinone) [Mycobacterium intracellulare subsp. chimaera]ASL21254.1 NADH dehydrogenase (quinone) [Mycobacterium intracellulare subsp. chimaera]MCF1814433.1 NADH-quinone oxidoreductase subunit L [Mycobacterium intracellulare subsp. intracellulare]MDM3929397.1 proton-conducting transporter membrane subunit [Mycobacterium intracellulare subsp. chimaera]MDM3935480.1 proton-conducting transp